MLIECPVRLDLIGDPLIDYWEDIDNDKTVICMGGAANVEQNVVKLIKENYIKKNKIYFSPAFRMPWIDPDFDIGPGDVEYGAEFAAKNYLIEESKVTATNHPNHPLESKYVGIGKYWYNAGLKTQASILIVSDYNKGFLEKNYRELLKNRSYDVCVVDSRYGDVDFNLLRDISKICVYRQTATDNYIDWDYDYRIVTNGPEKIVCENSYGEPIFTMPVLSKECVSCCGAGDVFTATVASSIATQTANMLSNLEEDSVLDIQSMLFNSNFSFINMLRQSCITALECCAEAIKDPYTCLVKSYKL